MWEDNVKLLKGNDPGLVARQRQDPMTLPFNSHLVTVMLRVDMDTLSPKGKHECSYSAAGTVKIIMKLSNILHEDVMA